ncbi:hypothetical protein D3C87_1298380 [compost metagenome]
MAGRSARIAPGRTGRPRHRAGGPLSADRAAWRPGAHARRPAHGPQPPCLRWREDPHAGGVGAWQDHGGADAGALSAGNGAAAGVGVDGALVRRNGTASGRDGGRGALADGRGAGMERARRRGGRAADSRCRIGPAPRERAADHFRHLPRRVWRQGGAARQGCAARRRRRRQRHQPPRPHGGRRAGRPGHRPGHCRQAGPCPRVRRQARQLRHRRAADGGAEPRCAGRPGCPRAAVPALHELRLFGRRLGCQRAGRAGEPSGLERGGAVLAHQHAVRRAGQRRHLPVRRRPDRRHARGARAGAALLAAQPAPRRRDGHRGRAHVAGHGVERAAMEPEVDRRDAALGLCRRARDGQGDRASVRLPGHRAGADAGRVLAAHL